LWKRLAYVAITRAQTRLRWVVRNRLARPAESLGIDDLKREPAPLALGTASSDGPSDPGV
jgi:exodeoxyribonuclease V